jgi:hypothetical protein
VHLVLTKYKDRLVCRQCTALQFSKYHIVPIFTARQKGWVDQLFADTSVRFDNFVSAPYEHACLHTCMH